MRTQTIAFLIFLFVSLSLSAQKNTWTIGLHAGVQGQIFTSIKQEYYRSFYMGEGVEDIIDGWGAPQAIIKHTLSHIPPVELTVKYNIGNRFSIATGVGYRNYYMKISNKYYNYSQRYDYIQVPIIFQYDIPFKKKGFAFFVQGGIGLDFEVNYTGLGYYDNEYYDSRTDKTYIVENSTESFFGSGGFNYLLHGGFGFSYTFNSGVGISLLGRYNIGAVYISHHSYYTIVKEAETDIIEYEMKEQVHGKAESWNVLLGVSYTFKQKKKE
jgi:hypothetical protein